MAGQLLPYPRGVGIQTLHSHESQSLSTSEVLGRGLRISFLAYTFNSLSASLSASPLQRSPLPPIGGALSCLRPAAASAVLDSPAVGVNVGRVRDIIRGG